MASAKARDSRRKTVRVWGGGIQMTCVSQHINNTSKYAYLLHSFLSPGINIWGKAQVGGCNCPPLP